MAGIKSKPVYAPLRADARGRYHLMLGRGPGGVALLRVLDELKAAAPALLSQTRVLFTPEPGHLASSPSNFMEVDASQPVGRPRQVELDGTFQLDGHLAHGDLGGASPTVEQFVGRGLGGVQSFPDAATLFTEYRSILERSLMGTRLYVAGPESFIGLAMRIALDFNLNKDEIRAEELGTLARRIYCVHCRTTTEDVRTNIVRCMGCDRWLLVRDHYSRRIAAYMGVMVDAEVPGELPPIQEVYA